uniref:Mif2/CENP-C cupin domain-containing protein n=1 Tax=Helobdella robusta TaxID=6412 RepID=T1G805_HELRO
MRRSKRRKVAVLDGWRGERIKYRWTPEGFENDGIISPKGQQNAKIERTTKKRRRIKTRQIVAEEEEEERKHFETESDCAVDDEGNSPIVEVFDLQLENHIPLECILKYYKSALLNIQTKEPAKESDPIVMTKGLTTNLFFAGIMEIKGLEEKMPQKISASLLLFNVSRGKLEVILSGQTRFIKTGDSFYVPPGNTYGLRNLRNYTAKLFYVNIKKFSF